MHPARYAAAACFILALLAAIPQPAAAGPNFRDIREGVTDENDTFARERVYFRHAERDLRFFGIREHRTGESAAAPLLQPVPLGGAWTWVAGDGEIEAVPVYEWTDLFYDGLARYQMGGRTGFITEALDLYIPPVYSFADRFQSGFAAARFDADAPLGFINEDGRFAVQPRFSDALRFREDVAAVVEDGLIGYIRLDGEYRIAPAYEAASSFHDGYAAVRKPGGPWQMIDHAGEARYSAPPEVTRLQPLRDGRAAFAVDTPDGERWGYLDERFRVVIPPRFLEARRFGSFRAAATPDGTHWGFIDIEGNWAVPPVYAAVGDFRGQAQVEVLDAPSRRIEDSAVLAWLQPIPGDLPPGLAPRGFTTPRDRNGIDLPEGAVAFGFIGIAGKTALPAVFTAAGDFRRGFAPAEFNGRYALVGINGALRYLEPQAEGRSLPFTRPRPIRGGGAHRVDTLAYDASRAYNSRFDGFHRILNEAFETQMRNGVAPPNPAYTDPALSERLILYAAPQP